MQTMPLVVMLIWFGPYQWYTQFSLYRSSFLSFYLYPAFPIFLNLHVFVFLSLTPIQPLVNISLSLSLFTSLYNFSSIYLCLLCFNLYFLVLSHHLALPSFSLFVLYISFYISINLSPCLFLHFHLQNPSLQSSLVYRISFSLPFYRSVLLCIPLNLLFSISFCMIEEEGVEFLHAISVHEGCMMMSKKIWNSAANMRNIPELVSPCLFPLPC